MGGRIAQTAGRRRRRLNARVRDPVVAVALERSEDREPGPLALLAAADGDNAAMVVAAGPPGAPGGDRELELQAVRQGWAPCAAHVPYCPVPACSCCGCTCPPAAARAPLQLHMPRCFATLPPRDLSSAAAPSVRAKACK